MSYPFGWSIRKENLSDWYFASGGTVTTAVIGEAKLGPVAVYSVGLSNYGSDVARVQLVNASTTGDAASATANVAWEMAIDGSGSITHGFINGIILEKGVVLNITATAGGVGLELKSLNAT